MLWRSRRRDELQHGAIEDFIDLRLSRLSITHGRRMGIRGACGHEDVFLHGDFSARSENSCDGEDVLLPIAWYCGNSGPTTHPVGQRKANAWGLHDMLGNAGEWVGAIGPRSDGYGEGPFVDFGAALDATGFLDPASPPFVQWRGGSWNAWPSLLSAGRANATPSKDFKGPGRGLRLAQTETVSKKR